MSQTIAVEVLIATPPTSKCEETIRILEELIRRHPDELRMVVFRRGVDFMPPELRLQAPGVEEDLTPKPVSAQMRRIIDKGSAVPYVVVDGENFSALEVPNLEELEARVQQILQATATK
jgi:hypothetical protein